MNAISIHGHLQRLSEAGQPDATNAYMYEVHTVSCHEQERRRRHLLGHTLPGCCGSGKEGNGFRSMNRVIMSSVRSG